MWVDSNYPITPELISMNEFKTAMVMNPFQALLNAALRLEYTQPILQMPHQHGRRTGSLNLCCCCYWLCSITHGLSQPHRNPAERTP